MNLSEPVPEIALFSQQRVALTYMVDALSKMSRAHLPSPDQCVGLIQGSLRGDPAYAMTYLVQSCPGSSPGKPLLQPEINRRLFHADMVSRLAEHLDWPAHVGLAYDLIKLSKEVRNEGLFLDALLPHVSPADNSALSSILRLVINEKPNANIAPEIWDKVIAHTTPEAIAGVLVSQLVHGPTPLVKRLARLTSAPLPVATVRQGTLAVNEVEGIAWFDAGLESALKDPNTPPELCRRLHDGCRAVRPHIHEARYQAEDRMHNLAGRSAVASVPRSRRRV